MKSRVIYGCFCICVCVFAANAQNSKGDQLLRDLEQIKHTQSTVDSLNKQTTNYLTDDLEIALEYQDRALTLARKISYKLGEGMALRNGASISMEHHRDLEKAKKGYQSALKIFRVYGSKRQIVNTLIDLGVVYLNQNETVRALEYFFTALQMFEEMGDSKGIMGCYINIANTYTSQKKYEQALEFHKKSLAIEVSNDSDRWLRYNNIGDVYKELGEYDMAITYLNKALAIGRKTGNHAAITYSSVTTGEVHMAKKNYAEAIPYLAESLHASKLAGFETMIDFGQESLSTCFNELGFTNDSLWHKHCEEQVEELEKEFLENIEILQQQKDTLSAQINSAKQDQVSLKWVAAISAIILMVLNFWCIFMYRSRS